MKLLNYTGAYFAGVLLIIITIWAAAFYYAMLGEIYDSIDDGLDNQKGLIIQKAATDTGLLNKTDFEEGDYAIREIPISGASNFRDTYIDTMMYMENEKSDEPVRLLKTIFLQQGKYYELRVATSMVEEDDLIKNLFYSILWLYVGLVLTIIIFNNFLLKRIWRPFYHLLRQVKKFQLDKPEPFHIPPTRVDEFKLLNEAVQRLLQKNIDTYRSQKQFIENASHELQTPLAISINKLETLAENNQLPEDQLRLLASAIDHLERLGRLNKSLVLLSKIENKQFTQEEPVAINPLVNQIVSDFSDQSDFKNIQVKIIEKESCIQKMNADLAAILFTNIIKNSIVHNKPGGFVNIILRQQSVQVENSGTDTALDKEAIFGRFHSGQPSHSSTGLGLAIAKAIADLYNFKISYEFEGKHTITLTF